MTTSERTPHEPLMTMREVATALGVSERTARSGRASGRLPDRKSTRLNSSH